MATDDHLVIANSLRRFRRLQLDLTNMQREQLRKLVLTEHNEVEFRQKATKPASRRQNIKAEQRALDVL